MSTELLTIRYYVAPQCISSQSRLPIIRRYVPRFLVGVFESPGLHAVTARESTHHWSAAAAKAIADVPGTAAPLAVLRQASRAVVPTLEKTRPFAQPRWELVAATPALRERELANFALLQDVSAEALMARGVPERQATLAAQVGVAALGQAIRDWMPDPAADFDSLLTEAFDDISELVRRRRRRRA
jgi:hypothetical protein